jgi:hypothetical protein
MTEKKDTPLAVGSNMANSPDKRNESTPEKFNDKTKQSHSRPIFTQPWTYGWIVAILTIFIAIFAYTQWDTLKTNMIIGQRAWVIVKKAEHGPTSPLNDEIAAKLTFVNSGSTPALKFKVTCVSDIREEPPKTVYDSIAPTEENSMIPIGPNETLSQLVEYKTAVNKGIWAGLHSGSIHFYVWGVAEYIDVFNEKRKTEFCFVSSKNTGIMKPCEGLNKVY